MNKAVKQGTALDLSLKDSLEKLSKCSAGKEFTSSTEKLGIMTDSTIDVLKAKNQEFQNLDHPDESTASTSTQSHKNLSGKSDTKNNVINITTASGTNSSSCKPPYSYIALIAMAIRDSPRKMATLSEINAYLSRKYEFFRGNYKGWRNSIRHNLSLNECFVKILRDPKRPWAKDNYWILNPNSEYTFADGVFSRRRKKIQCLKRDAGESEVNSEPFDSFSRNKGLKDFSIDSILSKSNNKISEQGNRTTMPAVQLPLYCYDYAAIMFSQCGYHQCYPYMYPDNTLEQFNLFHRRELSSRRNLSERHHLHPYLY